MSPYTLSGYHLSTEESNLNTVGGILVLPFLDWEGSGVGQVIFVPPGKRSLGTRHHPFPFRQRIRELDKTTVSRNQLVGILTHTTPLPPCMIECRRESLGVEEGLLIVSRYFVWVVPLRNTTVLPGKRHTKTPTYTRLSLPSRSARNTQVRTVNRLALLFPTVLLVVRTPSRLNGDPQGPLVTPHHHLPQPTTCH